MAQASLCVTNGGKSAVKAAAYRSGEALYCEETGKIIFYPRKQAEVVHTQILLPEHAPARLLDRATLWNEATSIEPYATSRVTREFRFSLPRELSQQQNIALAQDFARALTAQGMCVDLCIHDKGDGNPHVHLLTTTRPFNPDGTWGMKARAAYVLDDNGDRIRLASGRYKSSKVDLTNWNQRETLLVWRQLYQDITNEHLARAGVTAHIDVRSYAAQGLEKEPTKHLGPYAHRQEQRGIPTRLGDYNRDVIERNALREALVAKFDTWVQQARETLRQQAALVEKARQQKKTILQGYVQTGRHALNTLHARLDLAGMQLAGIIRESYPTQLDALQSRLERAEERLVGTIDASYTQLHALQSRLERVGNALFVQHELARNEVMLPPPPYRDSRHIRAGEASHSHAQEALDEGRAQAACGVSVLQESFEAAGLSYFVSTELKERHPTQQEKVPKEQWVHLLEKELHSLEAERLLLADAVELTSKSHATLMELVREKAEREETRNGQPQLYHHARRARFLPRVDCYFEEEWRKSTARRRYDESRPRRICKCSSRSQPGRAALEQSAAGKKPAERDLYREYMVYDPFCSSSAAAPAREPAHASLARGVPPPSPSPSSFSAAAHLRPAAIRRGMAGQEKMQYGGP